MEPEEKKDNFKYFSGNYQHSLDAKFRAFIPTKYKDALSSGFIITKGPDTCLLGYRNDAWDEMLALLREIPITDGDGREFIRNFVGYASDCTLDTQGRFNISTDLREYASLTKEICFVGAIDHFEIWDSALRKDESGRYDRNADIHAEKMQKYLKPNRASDAV